MSLLLLCKEGRIQLHYIDVKKNTQNRDLTKIRLFSEWPTLRDAKYHWNPVESKFLTFCTGSQTTWGNFLWKKIGLQGGYLTLKSYNKVKIFETAVVISLLKWNFWRPISPKRLIFFSKFFNSRRPCVCSMHHKNFSSFGGGRIFAPPPPPPQNGGFAVSGGSQNFFFSKLWGSIFFEG